jgi:catechol 2,3-dioxygenase-like lactoylglutathione lyase family enzyme
MKRLHVHVSAEDIEQSIRFYSAELGAIRINNGATKAGTFCSPQKEGAI